jgi:hypothetical protein
MAELGAGAGSGYPAVLDTDGTVESGSTTTSYNLVNDLADAILAIQAELGTDPALSKTTVKAVLQTEHDNDGEHTFKMPLHFQQDNVAASQSAVALPVCGTSAVNEIEMPWAGSIVGISVLSNDARTADTLTVDATINGTVTGLQAALDGTNTTHHSATQAKDTDAFVAGDRVGVKITTGASWTPVTADIVVVVFVSYN